jgi:Ras-related protein Rab-5C
LFFSVAHSVQKIEMAESNVTVLPMKITFLGDASVGKTSLVSRLARNHFANDHHSTIGAAFCVLKVQQRTYHIWDTAGQERYHSLIPLYLRDAAIVMIVYDINNKESFDHVIDRWLPFVHENVRGPTKPMIFLLGNKSDLAPTSRQILKSTATNFAQEHGLQIAEVSAKNASGVMEVLQLILDVDVHKPSSSGETLTLISRSEDQQKHHAWGCFGWW